MIYQDNQRGCEYFKSATLTVTSARCVITDETWKRENINSAYSRLYYVKSGGGRLTTVHEDILMKPGHIYLIPAELPFSHYPVTPMDKLFFHFHINMPNGFDLLGNVGKIKYLNVGDETIDEMYRLFLSSDFSDAFLLKAHLLHDICRLTENELPHEESFQTYSKEVAAAVKIILSAPSLKTTVKSLAASLYVSESYLAKAFKKEVGLTVGDYIDKIVMKEAMLLLSEEDEPIASLSDRLGFCDRFYFSRRFQSLFGETPAAYRKRMRIDH